ncbi:MAG: cytochrome c3 family protein [Deltaproteobacteria bacterium]|nr:cytochrome c3 family protein [Deltaproteobacteria bacterium]
MLFSHENHVANIGLKRTDCHAWLYLTKEKHVKTTMAQMQKGKSCGACHNGKIAFDVKARRLIVLPATRNPNAKLAMLIDLRKCTGCKACVAGCIIEHKSPAGVMYRPVYEEEYGRFPNVKREIHSETVFIMRQSTLC